MLQYKGLGTTHYIQSFDHKISHLNLHKLQCVCALPPYTAAVVANIAERQNVANKAVR